MRTNPYGDEATAFEQGEVDTGETYTYITNIRHV